MISSSRFLTFIQVRSVTSPGVIHLGRVEAIGQSCFQAKRASSSDAGWSVTTSKVHSHTTRKVYQHHIQASIRGEIVPRMSVQKIILATV